MSTYTFNPETHEYAINGRRVPSVTEILGDVLGLTYWNATQWHLDRGTAVHLACELHDEGRLDESTLDEFTGPRLRGWRKFTVESGFRAERIEERMIHAELGYTGKPDRVGTLDGKPCIVDIKSGAPAAWHGIQLAGYAMLLDGGSTDRVGVYLSEDKYRVKRYDDANDYRVFAAAVTVAKWIAKHDPGRIAR